MPLKLKTIDKDGATYAEVKDGKPIFIGDDNKELPFDAEQSRQRKSVSSTRKRRAIVKPRKLPTRSSRRTKASKTLRPQSPRSRS
jgi:hypothetical protein